MGTAAGPRNKMSTSIQAAKDVEVFPAKNATTTGLLLVGIAVGLLATLALERQFGADVAAALSLAAGYLLHSGVSLIRSDFRNHPEA